MPPDEKIEDLANDRLRGIEQIAAFLGETPRRVSYMVERDLIPYRKEGHSILSHKSWLRKHFAHPTQSNPAVPPS
jgi:hypothetical protein